MTKQQAEAHIGEVDAQRRAWTLLLYGVDWLSPSLYDLTINLETLNMGSAVEIAAAAVNCPEFAATSQSRKAMKDLFLESRVKAALASDAVAGSNDIEVHADSASGMVFLRGEVHPASVIDEMVRVAKGVAGATMVDGSQLRSADHQD